MSRDPPFNKASTPQLCPNGEQWNPFGYIRTHGHPGYICDGGDHFLRPDGSRDGDKEAILTKYWKAYQKLSEKHRNMAGKSASQKEALAEYLAPMKKKAIDDTWHECHDLQRKRKGGYVGPRPEKVEKISQLYERYKLRLNWVEVTGDGSEDSAGQQKLQPDDSNTLSGPSDLGPNFYQERAEAQARAEADKQGKIGGNNRGGKLTDEGAAAVNRVMTLKSSQSYELLGLDPAEKASFTRADITKAFYEQSMLVDPVINGHKQALTAHPKISGAKNYLLTKHRT